VKFCYVLELQDNVTLCTINILFPFPGILQDVRDEFKIGDDLGGLLQTAFVLSYMIFAPLFGYLGDRYSRRLIMAFGVLLWSLTTLLGSFMHVSEGFTFAINFLHLLELLSVYKFLVTHITFGGGGTV
jgi:MFS family permease